MKDIFSVPAQDTPSHTAHLVGCQFCQIEGVNELEEINRFRASVVETRQQVRGQRSLGHKAQRGVTGTLHPQAGIPHVAVHIHGEELLASRETQDRLEAPQQ
ncbi:MAG: hypothetical protein BWY63_01170 [Chloroflexi bacterium ADurb.Bin360]|nr:MAG: hypothetical protein BWY63_01170 [Chloroflexi bacterium ADurb.Bin360]